MPLRLPGEAACFDPLKKLRNLNFPAFLLLFAGFPAIMQAASVDSVPSQGSALQGSSKNTDIGPEACRRIPETPDGSLEKKMSGGVSSVRRRPFPFKFWIKEAIIMKKTISVILLLVLLLAACGKNEAPAQTKLQDGENTQIANPWREITEDEAKAIYPQSFSVPEGAENAVWRVMETADAPALLELDFDLDGLRFTARQQETGNRDADLSGMYYTWTAQVGMTLRNGLTGTMYRNISEDGYADVCVWYDEAAGVSYSLSVTAKDLDGFDLQAVAEALFPPTAPSLEEQKRILEENRSLWSFDEGEYAPDWYYAFTDLDHNGLLEVLSASTQGSGVFTYAHFYEVLPDGSGVRNLYHADAEIEGADDWPEIILDQIPCYYDSAADRYYYVCSNSFRDGAWHGMTQLAALSLKDAAATIEYLAAEEILLTDSGEQWTYTDGAGEPITEEDFNSALERRFAGMEQSELKLDWIAVNAPQVETRRQDGERFEAVIILEGMEETVHYEHIRNETVGFEMDYDYESFERRSEADRESFVSVWDDPDDPWNYLEVTHRPEDAETAAAAIGAELSKTYEIRREDSFPLDRAGSCIRIDASADIGGLTMPEHLQMVYIIPVADGCLVATGHYTIESAEGFGARFSAMMQTLSAIGRN